MFDALDTPQVLVEQRVMENNLKAMQRTADQLGKKLRPHVKTHKSAEWARRQMELGADGIMVAKLDEAEVMVAAGIMEQSVGYPLIGRLKADRLTRLIQLGLKPRVSVDSLAGLKCLAEVGSRVDRTVDVVIEIDTGLHRVGLAKLEHVVELAERISRERYVTFRGITCFGGHLGKQPSRAETVAAIEQEDRHLEDMVAGLRRSHLDPEVVSEGGTIPAAFAECLKTATELRPGTYIYNDVATVEAGAASYPDCAATILATVVSTPDPHWVVIDAGSKSLSSDGSRGGGLGHVQGRPELLVVRMNEEHGMVARIDGGPVSAVIGDRLRIIPNHICTAINLHRQVVVVDGERVVQTVAISAQGGVH